MKLRRLLALMSICAMLFGISPVSTSATADLHPLKNGGFESGNITHWQAATGVSPATAAAHEGNFGCLITGDGDWDDLLSQTFTVLPGYSYTLSFWYKAQPMGVSWYLLDGKTNARLYRGWAGETSWTKVVHVFTPTSDTVRLLYRGSGSHVAERVYLDCVEVTLNPCEIHIYDNDCDPICNICATERPVGNHFFDHDCDIFCNSCGFEREPSGKHTYDFPCATLCNYCGAPRVGLGAHTYNDICDETCEYCGEWREVPHFYDFPCDPSCSRCGAVRVNISEDLHTYDDEYDATCSLCDHVRVPTPKPMERLSSGGAACSEINADNSVGLAFRFFLESHNGQKRGDNAYISRSAMVCRYNNGVEYALIGMGAVLSNEKNPILDLEHLTSRTIDVKAVYLCDLNEENLSFAVRIVNIPVQGRNTLIQARPYYVYSDGTEQIVVYGETVSTTYNELANGV